MRTQIIWRGTALASNLLGGLMLAHAVDVNTRTSGTVTDASSAVHPNVHVTLISEATGFHQVTGTRANGGLS